MKCEQKTRAQIPLRPTRDEVNQGDRKKIKKLERAVHYAERNIEELENKIADFEKQMAQPGFYEDTKSQKVLEDFNSVKLQLETAMEEWGNSP